MYQMRAAASTQIHGFRTDAFSIPHRPCQLLGISALLRLTPGVRAGPSPVFCEPLAQLFFSALLFNPFFLSLSTKIVRVSGPGLSLS